MYRWCAYCQRYLGEKPPFDNLSLTHGICTSCLSLELAGSPLETERIWPIIDFVNDVRAMAMAGEWLPVEGVVNRGRELGMRPVDLLVGILQPILYEVGSLWEQGKLDPTREATFTSFSEAVLAELAARQPTTPGGPVVVLMNVRWNRHTLGLRMAAFLLRERGFDARVLWPTPASDRLVEALREHGPAVVGVSLATDWQSSFLDEVLEAVKFLVPCPQLVAGGAAVRAGCELPPGVEVWGSSTDPLREDSAPGDHD